MKKIKSLTLLFVAVSLMLINFSCTSNKAKKNSKKINIFYANWAEGIAVTYLTKAAFEDKGYEVELTNLAIGLIYGELSKSDSKGDVFMDTWLPNTNKELWDRYGAKLDKLGAFFTDGTIGLVVPTYVSINSIEELNANVDKFEGQIIGIGNGTGTSAKTEKAIDQYGLNFEQIATSGPAMVASLQKAVKNKEWVVITGWKPHYMWAENDIKYLKDPKNIFPTDACTIISRKDFKKEKPGAAKFFENINLSETQLYELMFAVRDMGEVEGTTSWYTKNKAMVNAWFK
jgi:glycine betaine/proline transport system substrate-binding protein